MKWRAFGISLISRVLLTIIFTNFRDILRRKDIVGDSFPPVFTYLGLIMVRSLTAKLFSSRNILRGPLAFAHRHTLYHRRIPKVRMASQKVKLVEFLSAFSL